MKARALCQEATSIVVLTGAGMSTDSGIPDFRSSDGMYRENPESILSRETFFQKPDLLYRFLHEKFWCQTPAPNRGHFLLKEWEDKGKEMTIFTQNIDGLHRVAGSQHVTEFHGNLKTATCTNPKCGKKVEMKTLFDIMDQDPRYYMCDCSKSTTKRYYKPDIVLYGDHVGTRSFMSEARETVWGADLLLVLGTSLNVYPFADLVRYRNKKNPTIIVSKGPTPFDREDDIIKIEANIAETLQILSP
ncbi:NAD-dependent protein deacylase (plasmid) [Pontibacillus sp. ALD_SL1]|uniref:SIR2 family NAD-dependent protein deacylase n=1 Tax=Pontibacillus sp. ALD_SL1 TaxID=2777185 RepID=UPI001A95B961|nr:Sir2 family NAD-dependent protein deacetylase [Pontibacillus sp. ALD_SL1]QST02790.1 NAD-dependent protein deacylase [Pontibacillus sp. ALD_SL1]